MSTSSFFKKFPVVQYANSNALNLLSRVSMSKLALNNRQVYYPYVMQEGQRPDNLSYDYYDNSDLVWLIALTNQVIDPYYDFSITEANLQKFLVKKYGSLLAAQNLIIYFQTNYSSDESNISVSAYDALPALPDYYEGGIKTYSNLRKYWNPQIGINNTILGYVRKKETWVVNTNKVVQTTLDTANSTFIINERVTQNNIMVATVSSLLTTTLTLQHVYGTISNTSPLIGETSNAQANVISSAVISQSLADSEFPRYWSPVTAYEYESLLNHSKRFINLLDNKYSSQAVKELTNTLNN